MTPLGGLKYIICNAVDADPCSRSRAACLGRDMDAVLAGLLIAAEESGATQAYLCINAGDEESTATVEAAVHAAGEGARDTSAGVAGAATGKDQIEIHVVPISASLVLGDESALLRVLEGRQAIPHVRVPPSAPHTLWGQVAVAYGVETLARLAPGGPVARLLTVWWGGDARVVEASPVATLREVVRDVTGVEPDAAWVKAVRFGGATGRFYAGADLDLPIGDEAEQPFGVIEVIPAGTCGVELAQDAIRYLAEQSCGGCVACREGTRQIADLLDDIAGFQAAPGSLELLQELAEALEAGSICFLGRGAAGSLRSSLELFVDDYRAHLEDTRCPGELADV